MVLHGAERFPRTPALGAPCSMDGVVSVLGTGLWGGCFPRAGQDGAVPWNPKPRDVTSRCFPVLSEAASTETAPNSSHQWPSTTHQGLGAPRATRARCQTPALPPHPNIPDHGWGRGGLMPHRRETPRQVLVVPAAPARCRCFIPRLPGSHPEPLRVIVEQSTKREVPSSGSPRHLGRGRGCGRGRQRWLCSSILPACHGRLTCSPAGLPRPPAQRRRSCRPTARVERVGGQHHAPPNQDPLYSPQIATHSPGHEAGAQPWGDRCCGPRGGWHSPAKGTAAPR